MESSLSCLIVIAVVVAVANAQAGLPPGVRPVVCKPAGIDLCNAHSVCETVAVGVQACMCKQGYIQNPNSPLECTDFDECAYYTSQGLDLCRAGQYGRCINEIGDYRCQCDARFYTTSGSERYCEKKPLFGTPAGQFMFYRTMFDMGDW